MNSFRLICALVTAALLCACGGGDPEERDARGNGEMAMRPVCAASAPGNC
jgi:hypothetical protein